MAGAGRLQPRSWNVELRRPIGLSDEMLPPALDPTAIFGSSNAKLGAVEESDPRKNHAETRGFQIEVLPCSRIHLVRFSACTRQRMTVPSVGRNSRPCLRGGAWRQHLVPAAWKATKDVAALVCTSWYLKQAVFGMRRVEGCDELERRKEA